MDWEGSEKVNVNVLKDNFVCRMSFLHNDFYRPSTWQGRHFFSIGPNKFSNITLIGLAGKTLWNNDSDESGKT